MSVTRCSRGSPKPKPTQGSNEKTKTKRKYGKMGIQRTELYNVHELEAAMVASVQPT